MDEKTADTNQIISKNEVNLNGSNGNRANTRVNPKKDLAVIF